MSSRASPSEQPKKVPEGAEFGDLLRGRIDILEYLQTEGAGDPHQHPHFGVQTPDSLPPPAHAFPPVLMIPPPSAVLHHQPPPHSQSNVPKAAHLASPLTVDAKPGQGQQRMDGRHHFGARLPDSPPETDSAAGSAGSPSSASDNSPCSPEFQAKAKAGQAGAFNGPQSVIRHPGAGQPPVSAAGVILDPTLASLAQQGFPVGGDPAQFYAAAAAGGHQTAQTSPPGGHPGQCPTPYLLPPDPALYNPDGALARKRLRADSTGAVAALKRPELASPRTSIDDYDMEGYQQQCIRFSEFQKENWNSLCDVSGRDLTALGFHVVADKGFNFSTFDGTFVNQKKNHFQISVHIEAHDPSPPKLVRVNGELKAIREFRLDFYGAKAELPTSTVMIKQSQTDRKPVPYSPVTLDLPASRVTKVTVARLHFSETTMNNQRKNGRPNPDQKFFQLVVALNARLTNGEEVMICAHASEKVIVRASNPGQFDNGESDVPWQKGSANGSIYHMGQVAVGTERAEPNFALTVAGSAAVTGQVLHPSDRKFKENIAEVDYKEALRRLSELKIVQYEIKPEVAERWGLTEEERQKVGVIAQELEKIIPDAVRGCEDEEGDEFLQVDDSRIFYESAAAVKELCRLTGNLEYKIEEVERISRKLSKLSKLKRLDSMRSSTSLASRESSGIASSYTGLSCSRSTLADSKGPKTTSGRKPESRHHRHCHHYCRQPDGLCSNKLIQSTIIVLVIIMAFCLVAMATLYILDWQQRNGRPNGSHYGPNYGQTPLAGNATTRPDHAGIPPGQMFIPRDPSGSDGRRVNWAPDWPGGVRPPEIQPCKSLDCQAFCCPNVYSYVASKVAEEARLQAETSSGEALEVQLLPDAATPASAVGQDFARKEPVVVRAKRAIMDQPGLGKTSEGKSAPVKKLLAATPPEEELGGVRMSIMGQNLTLSRDYCLPASCSDAAGNYTLYIPVSSAMPLIPLSVRFDVRQSMGLLSYCGPTYEVPDSLCPGAAADWASLGAFQGPPHHAPDEPQSVHQKHTNIFELPVGIFMGSAYKFRLGFSPSACAESGESAGESFKEFTLVFYRTCGL